MYTLHDYIPWTTQDDKETPSPYVHITVGREQYQTTVLSEACNPCWDEGYTFEVRNALKTSISCAVCWDEGYTLEV